MSMAKDVIEQVGAPDPELKTSPILDERELDEHAASRDLELESATCWFNGVEYAIGRYVRSGDELLLCGGRGVWMKKGEVRP